MTTDNGGSETARWSRSVASNGARVRRDALMLGLLALGVFCAYLALERGKLDSWDGQAMASVGRNLLEHHRLTECCHAFGAYPKDPGPYAKFGIGYSLVLAPLWHFQLTSRPDGALWLGLANPALLTATAVTIAKTGLTLGWRRSTVVAAALSFAFLTMAPLYSTTFYSEPGVTFGASLLVLGFAMWQQRASGRGAALIGLGTACAILFRPDSIVLFGPVVALMLLFEPMKALRERWRSWLPHLLAPLVVVLAWTMFYDHLRYGSVLQLGYSGAYDSRGFSTPLLDGVGVLLWSPGKSFFVYSPILIVAIPGIVLMARRIPRFALVVAAIAILRILVYAKWWTPEGGSTWGPRFLLPLCAVLTIPFGEALERVGSLSAGAKRAAIGAIAGIAAVSAVVQSASLLVDYHGIYRHLFDTAGVPPERQLPVFLARVHRTHWTLGGTQIVWNLRHLGGIGGPSPLYWFSHRQVAFAALLLALAAACCLGGAAIARLSDRLAARATTVG